MAKNQLTKFLFLLISGLVGFSLVFFFTLSSVTSLNIYGNTTHFFFRQVLFGLLPALVAGFIAYKMPLSFIKKWAMPLVIVNLITLFLVFIPGIGVRAGGASRWVRLFGIGFQPSEFLKVSAIIYLSAWIASRLSDEHAKDWKHTIQKTYHNIIFILLPFLAFLGIISISMFLQKDASTLGIISLTLLSVYFSARTPLWHTGVIIFLGASALLLLVKFESYRLDRFMIFLNPDFDPLGIGFQLKQSIISIGSGGLFGKGLGMSIQKFGNLPEAITDSIFAIIGEEMGFIGVIILIGVFITLFIVGLKLYKQSNDTFSKLLSVGIVFWICLQAFINMASSAGIFPLAGIPLPFFSYGGSHLIAEMIGIGLLLNVSKHLNA